MSVNQAIILGNVGRDPEVRSMNSGDTVASFSVATTESWKDKSSGEKKERTEWHNVVSFNQGINKVIDSYVKKGTKVFIQGALRTRKYEKDGVEKYTTEIVIEAFRGMLSLEGGKNEESGGGGASRSSSRPPADKRPMSEQIDDDIPF